MEDDRKIKQHMLLSEMQSLSSYLRHKEDQYLQQKKSLTPFWTC